MLGSVSIIINVQYKLTTVSYKALFKIIQQLLIQSHMFLLST